MQNWDATWISRSPLFEPLGVDGAVLRASHWPELAALQALVSARAIAITTGSGQPLRLVTQDAGAGAFEDRYEVRIYREGALPLRTHNWHDLFNLLVWIAFPRAKAALNARHYHALLGQQARGALNRGPAQDALTLFDESGMIVVSSDATLLQDLRDFAWTRLFWERRAQVMQRMHWLVFGHGLYEKALQPFVGITGHGVLIDVEPDFHALPLVRQRDFIDEALASRIADTTLFQATRELAPVPLLGVPGWWPANNQLSFYENTAYFRLRRRAVTRVEPP